MKRIFLSIFIISFIAVAIGGSTNSIFQSQSLVDENNFSTGTWSEPVINEIYPHPATGQVEWIELLNTRPEAKSLAGCTIEDNTASPKNLSAYTIPANGYLVLRKGTDFSFALNDGGDILKLKCNSDVIDQAAYGNYNDGNLLDNAPAPLQGQSIARSPDGVDTNLDINDFQIFIIPTPGGPNV